MANKSVTLEPVGGWDRFRRGADVEELVWEVLASWHFMNPTAKTSVWESDSGATFYLAHGNDGGIVELVAGYVAEEDEELDDLVAQLGDGYGIRAKS